MDRRERAKVNSANASRQGRNTFWTPARTALLFAFAFDGLKASAVAARIGDGCTKNMVISKAKREKLELRSRESYLAEIRSLAGQRKNASIRRRIEKLQAQLAATEKPSPSRVSCETKSTTVSA